MAKNIKIVPSNAVSRTSDRVPYIDFLNGTNPLDLKVLSGAVITFSSATTPNILSIDPTNTNISGTTLNVKDYFAVGSPGTQVLNSTLNWIGPTTNIQGAQGAQGATGNLGGITNATPPSITINLASSTNSVYSTFGTRFYSTGFLLNGTGSTDFTYVTSIAGGNYSGTLWANPNSNLVDGPLNRTGRWTAGSSNPIDTWVGYSACLNVVSGTKTYYVGIAADNDFRLVLDSVTILNTIGGPYDDVDLAFKWWHVYPVVNTTG